MALLESEGFGWSTTIADYFNYGAYVSNAPTDASIGTGGPFGDNYVSFTISTVTSKEMMARNLAAAVTSFFAGFRTNLNTGTGNSVTGYFFADSTGAYQLTVVFNANLGTVSVYSGSNATLLGTSAGSSVPTSGWFFLEVGAVIASGTGGSVTIRCNGATILNITGVNTNTTGNGNVQQFGVTSAGCVSFESMHWYFCDGTGAAPWNTYLGDVRVQTLLPDSNDAVGFTPVGNSQNWQNVSLVPPVPSTDYNESPTVSTQDTFNCGTLEASLGVVLGVNIKALLYKNDAGSRVMQTVIKNSGTVTLGNPFGLGLTSEQTHTMYEENPVTAAAFTHADVNAMKIGYKINA